MYMVGLCSYFEEEIWVCSYICYFVCVNEGICMWFSLYRERERMKDEIRRGGGGEEL
jgi:hypothetical protein